MPSLYSLKLWLATGLGLTLYERDGRYLLLTAAERLAAGGLATPTPHPAA